MFFSALHRLPICFLVLQSAKVNIIPLKIPHCTVRLYGIAPSAYMVLHRPPIWYCTVRLYGIAPSAYMVLHRPPIWYSVLHHPPIYFHTLFCLGCCGGPAAEHLRLSLRKQNRDGHAKRRALRRSLCLYALLRGDVERTRCVLSALQRLVNGFPIGAAAGVVQKAAVPFNRGEFNLVGVQKAGIGVLVRQSLVKPAGQGRWQAHEGGIVELPVG